eukprot:CAMPEP_0183303580 /NCGR_PEP_ID=MMETSP0160_2-20130417/8964_1 /TAXON_ID=2839 ORGANISM="Odontella Sinensis, Strain Grunow 1884" /NCGR_SAMPLE_ID=MMETSP0160_2 /ASSEMBLY_ACC=CAM_ASM_000250 /LENGTH=324 /DNA_ID=CAMNT_0025466503 /DNA_START=18 /DNA_END=992 /DNA_ORIENTATION=-
MADLRNLLDEVEDHETSGLSPFDDDAEGLDLDSINDGTHVDGQNDPVESQRAASAVVPHALAEAQRFRASMPRNDDEEGIIDSQDYSRKYETGSLGGDDGGDDGGASADPEYEQLKSLWAQELMCPELLPYDEETVALHLELLRGQEDTIEELQENAASGGGGSADPMLAHLAAGVYKMEADRVRFLLADLTRNRLAKIENYALHSRELVDRMSEEEVAYLTQYGELLERHLCRSVVNHLPSGAFKKLDEPEMIDRPDLDEFVFCRCLETVEIDNNKGQEEEVNIDDEDEFGGSIQKHPEGSCLIARYATVRDLVLQGKVVLLM